MAKSPRADEAIGLVRLGLWIGLLVGFGELALLGVMEFVLDRYIYYVSPQVIWMIPVADMLIFGTLGAILAGLRTLMRDRLTLPVAVWLLSFIGFIALAYFVDDRVHDIALFLLSAGAATQASRLTRGHPVGFRAFMRWSTPLVVALIVTAAVFAESRGPLKERAALAELGAADEGAPNVLLIIWDTVRSHDLSAYGHDEPTTPALERLAASGTIFDQAMSTASWTLPSHASMFTGHYPDELSVNYTTPLDDAEPTLAEALAERGYVTGGFVGNFGAAGWESGLARGFVRYEDFPRTLGQLFINARLIRTLFKVRLFRDLIGYHDVLGRKGAPPVSRGFLDWQAEHADRPFFAFLNYYDAHAPYLPPEEYATRFGAPRPDGDPLLIERMNASEWTPEALQAELDAYKGAIAYLDDRLAEVLDELERRGVLDNTLIILTSDHGEEFGEHDMLGHGDLLYAPLIRVPLVVSMPGVVPSGETVRDPVSLRNLPRTVLDLLDAPTDAHFPGYSLRELWTRPAIDGATAEMPSGPSVPTEEVEVEPAFSHDEGLVSIVRGRHHYIVDDEGAEELFDVIADPLEQNDLAADPDSQGVLSEFRAIAASRTGSRR